MEERFFPLPVSVNTRSGAHVRMSPVYTQRNPCAMHHPTNIAHVHLLPCNERAHFFTSGSDTTSSNPDVVLITKREGLCKLLMVTYTVHIVEFLQKTEK